MGHNLTGWSEDVNRAVLTVQRKPIKILKQLFSAGTVGWEKRRPWV